MALVAYLACIFSVVSKSGKQTIIENNMKEDRYALYIDCDNISLFLFLLHVLSPSLSRLVCFISHALSLLFANHCNYNMFCYPLAVYSMASETLVFHLTMFPSSIPICFDLFHIVLPLSLFAYTFILHPLQSSVSDSQHL